jgi:hypothetical protein
MAAAVGANKSIGKPAADRIAETHLQRQLIQ